MDKWQIALLRDVLRSDALSSHRVKDEHPHYWGEV